jgi:hypothetical protein
MPSILRYLGIGIEDEFGSAVGADQHYDIASATLDAPTETEMEWPGGLSRGRRTRRPGPYVPGGNVVCAVDVNTIFYLLYLLFGDYEQDGPDEELYTYSLQPQRNNLILPSGTFLLGKDAFEHEFAGGTVSQLTLNVDKEFARATADVIAQKDAKNAIKAEANLTMSAAYPLAFHELTVELDEGDESAYVESVTLTINNNAAGDAGVNMGSRYPARIYAGDIQVSFSLNVAFEDTGEKEKFWGGANGPSDDGSTSVDLTLTFDSGSYGSLVFSLPSVIYDAVPIQPSGRDRIVQNITGRAFYDDTSETEILATLENKIDHVAVIS